MKIKGAVALLLVTCCMGGVVCRQNKTEETAACTLAVGDAELRVRETYKTTLTRKEDRTGIYIRGYHAKQVGKGL